METFLIGTYGYAGSGKTYFSKHLCDEKGWFHLAADRIRLKLFSEPLYTPAEHETVFGFMDYLAEELLGTGMSVVYDAHFNFKKDRDKLQLLATKAGAEYRIAHIQTPETIALKRLPFRHENADESEKDIHRPISEDIFHQLKDEMEPLDSSEPIIEIDGTKDFSEQLIAFEQQLGV